MRPFGFLVGLGLLAASAGAPAGDLAPIKPIRPIEGTDRLAQPAAPAPLTERKRFIKADPHAAPHLSPPPEQAGPILPPLTLQGHHDVRPSTTKPLKAVPPRGKPLDGG